MMIGVPLASMSTMMLGTPDFLGRAAATSTWPTANATNVASRAFGHGKRMT
jgi:hypothetical protein